MKQNTARERPKIVYRSQNVKSTDRGAERQYHIYGPGIKCVTEGRGYSTPKNRSLTEIVLDASRGFIPLWKEDTTLRWRFQERSLSLLDDQDAAQDTIKELMAEALLTWGDAVPVKFAQVNDNWDFEFVVKNADDCELGGCVLASAFFPDAGQHELAIYPKMFTQSTKEQVDTLIHEFGHVFGLRHFFAQVSEEAWPSEVFGVHKPFTIMNYGGQSELTDDDRADLMRLYQTAWCKELTQVNGTPIRFVEPFHANRDRPQIRSRELFNTFMCHPES